MQWLSDKFELSRNDGSGNVRPMEGMRGFAVFLVFLVHFASMMAPWISKHSALATAALKLHAIGNAGVDLFFVLSGYLIYGSLMARQQAFVPFMRRRIRRIYPAFSVVFLVYLLLSILQPATSKIPADGAGASLYIVQNFLLLPGIFKIEPIVTVAWSLSYEMLYYLVLPPLLSLLGMRVRSGTWRSTFFILAGAGILVSCTMYDGPLRLVMFIGGILLHEALRVPIKAPRGGYTAALVIAGLAFQAAPYYGEIAWATRIVVLLVAFFFLCLHCFTTPRTWLARFFSLTPLRWLGNMSYSYYLLHGLALKVSIMMMFAVVPKVSHEVAFTLAALPVMFILTLLPSAALFLLIERPLSLNKKAPPHLTPTPLAAKAIG